MPRRLPPNVEKNVVKGHVYLSYRVGKGPRIRLPEDPTSDDFKTAYAAAVAGEMATRPAPTNDAPRSIGALVTSYLGSEAFKSLGVGSKSGYRSRMDQIRRDHGHRSVVGLTKERIEEKILKLLSNKPGAKLDTLKKLRARAPSSAAATSAIPFSAPTKEAATGFRVVLRLAQQHLGQGPEISALVRRFGLNGA